MAVDSRHPEYVAAAPQWSRARDVLSGEDAVKAEGERYLPRLDSQSDAEYAAYKMRAAFFGAMARTVEEYLDLIFRSLRRRVNPYIFASGPPFWLPASAKGSGQPIAGLGALIRLPASAVAPAKYTKALRSARRTTPPLLNRKCFQLRRLSPAAALKSPHDQR